MLMTMYAGGGYSSDIEVGVEKVVGTITIDGTKYTRYVKIVDCGALPSVPSGQTQGLKNVAHGISFVGILGVYGTTKHKDIPTHLPIPYNGGGSGYIAVVQSVTTTDIVLIATYNWSATYTKTYITIEYYR